MASIYDVDVSELVSRTAEELKKEPNIKPTSWADFVKTGANKERTPVKKDWWYVRAASILKTIYKYGPIGVSKLRVKYGGKKRRGYKPPKFYRGSGNIIRKILQQLEKSGLVKKTEKIHDKGRVITPKGKSMLDKIATQIYKNPLRMEAISKETKVNEIQIKELPKEAEKIPKEIISENKDIKEHKAQPEKIKPKKEKLVKETSAPEKHEEKKEPQIN